MTIYGIDVSSYQAKHYPLTVSGGHAVSFAMIKATEGLSYVNPDMKGQRDWARAHGHVVGYYHFVQPGDMKRQAAYFAAKCLSAEGDVLALDWEVPGVSGADKDVFLKELKRIRPTHRVLLYCSQSYWTTRDTTSYAADGLWIAQYNGHPGRPSIQAKWLIHQYTSAPVDSNVATWSTKADMTAWAHGLMADSGQKADKPADKPKPAAKTVSLKRLVSAAKSNPPAKGHPVTYSGVRTVEDALVREHLLSADRADGHFGTDTVKAYSAWQRRCGYSGHAADGVPGMATLRKLAAKYHFTVTA